MNNISHPEEVVQFFKLVTAEIKEDEGGAYSVCSLIEPVLDILQKEIQSGSILILPVVALNTLEAFARISEFALVKKIISLF